MDHAAKRAGQVMLGLAGGKQPELALAEFREVGLEQLVEQGFSIVRAVPSRKWPGSASLEVAHVWLRRDSWDNQFVLDELPVEGAQSLVEKWDCASGLFWEGGGGLS